MQTVKNYQQAKDYLGNKRERPYANNTRLEYGPLELGHEVIVAKYHGNIVASFYPDRTAYSSAGWKTTTTKERINWFLPVGFSLYQEKSVWYVVKHGSSFRYGFADEFVIDSAGNVYNDSPADEQAQIKAQIKAIKAYVGGYIKALLNNEIESPSGGDCWYCFMRTKDGKTWGEASNSNHIESHIEESYYVPSLLVRAIEFTGRASAISKDGIYRLWNGESISNWQASIVERDVKSCLTAHIKHALGIAQ